jgi:ATPase subunit of ABC transporter with duplicated ATPase domains
VKEISKNYGDKRILNNVSFDIHRGDKVVIIGANGIGKSTLLKIVLDKIKADVGSYEWGYEPQISYFAQDHHELLNESMNVLEWLTRQAETKTTGTIRTVLGQVRFSQDDGAKNILPLSGGEGARLLLAKIILEKGNILVLDEPTNHLDIESRESLKEALINYPGTVILVTHDRDFATAIASRVIALTTKKMVDFKGSYQEYLSRHSDDYLNSNWVIGNNK